jgi:hypothetical protein
MKTILVAFFAFWSSVSGTSQPDSALADSTAFTPDTITLKPVMIFSYGDMTAAEITAFRTMLARINKLYPFLQEALALMRETDAELASLERKKKQNRYRKDAEKELREEYKDQLKQFTVGETETFIKMIERSTGLTLYDVIKKYKSGTAAAWWQSVAKLAGIDLREGYDPKKWKDMEYILSAIEAGMTIPDH